MHCIHKAEESTLQKIVVMNYKMSICQIIVLQGVFLTGPPNLQYQNEKTMDSQSEILVHEILNVQKILIGWTKFFFLALKFGRTS